MSESSRRKQVQSDDLSLFVLTVEHGSFSGAGMAAGLTPTAVSKRIAKLEERLGVRLLERTTRSLKLTESGRFISNVLAASQLIFALPSRLRSSHPINRAEPSVSTVRRPSAKSS